MLPGLRYRDLPGLRARPDTKALPIIMLTARKKASVRAFTGADDYIVVVFASRAHGARHRSAGGTRAGRRRTFIRDVELDREKKRVTRAGRPVGSDRPNIAC
jgi:two-component system phosphate regulon response regulator PhoB